jgi:hypothetical protein
MFGLAKQAAHMAQRQISERSKSQNNSSNGSSPDKQNDISSHGRSPHRTMTLLRSSSKLSDVDDIGSNFDKVSSNRTLSASSDEVSSSVSSGCTGEAGLQIYVKDGHVRLGYCYDCNLREIHPNVFCPSSLQNVKKVGGGGSGVAVFCGTHPELGPLVMKHGGFKDLTELFALATIAEELRKRGESTRCKDSAKLMQDCLPSFQMIYISPHHIFLKKNQDYWTRLKKLVRIGNLLKFNTLEEIASSKRVSLSEDTQFLTPGMSIRIYERPTQNSPRDLCDTLDITLDDDSLRRKPSLSFALCHESIHFLRSCTIELVGASNYSLLKQIYNELLPIMTDNYFKFTLAQERIGGPNAKTGNQWLYEKKLSGKLLQNLVTQFCEVVHNLQNLTLPKEQDVVDQIRAEMQRLENKKSKARADDVSSVADQFCGNAIKKNFHPTKGRLRFFRQVCQDFREHNLILTAEEEIPAKHLGNMMLSDALMSDTFVNASTEPTLLQPNENFWRNLLARAVDNRKSMSSNALKRVWNSGLADAGIHNLFVSENDIYFFDLGEPTMQSIPGFMTKFLFSFFHTLGMQEDAHGEWIRRFVVQGPRLALTPETDDLLNEAYNAFEVALNGIIDNVFDGDQALRWLLLQYVTLQLLSDAAFCLQKWEIKGGGGPRHGNHNTGLEKWLWRALWDCYVAFDINTADSWLRFDVENPQFRESLETVRCSMRESIRISDAEAWQHLHTSSYTTSDTSCASPSPHMVHMDDVSLRDLTLSTYKSKRSDSVESIVDGILYEEDEGENEDFLSSDDDSAIAAPVGIHLQYGEGG